MQYQRNLICDVSTRNLFTLPMGLGRTGAVDIGREKKSKTMQMQNKCAWLASIRLGTHTDALDLLLWRSLAYTKPDGGPDCIGEEAES